MNLFVATFLGTPPINVFEGRVEAEKLYIGQEAVLKVKGAADQAVTVAIRPEGFELAREGKLTCRLSRVEVMGRDISVVCDHPFFTGESFRAIVDSDDLPRLTGTTVRFDLKPNKVFLFREDNGQRIRF